MAASTAAASGKVALLRINAGESLPPPSRAGCETVSADVVLFGLPLELAERRLREAIRQGHSVAWLHGAGDLDSEEAAAKMLIAAGVAFERRDISSPLAGQRVVITRPRHQSEGLWQRLTELGAEVLSQPAIAIGPPADWAPADAALAHLEDYRWLVFSSSNGVRALLDRLRLLRGDIRAAEQVKLAAIGPGTAEELARYQLQAALVPTQYRAEALAESLVTQARGVRFLLARASRGREVLAEQLTAAGGIVEQVVVYSSTDVLVPDAEVAAALPLGRIDWITVTSSAIARSLAQLFGPALAQARLASISPITSQTLRELGYTPSVEAREHTMDGLLEAVLRGMMSPSPGAR